LLVTHRSKLQAIPITPWPGIGGSGGALRDRDVKNEGASADIYENKGPGQNVTPQIWPGRPRDLYSASENDSGTEIVSNMKVYPDKFHGINAEFCAELRNQGTRTLSDADM
jgi:hypothetical protein